ncbi:probable carboxylesterase 2 [Impatiens glandulifera]|uniref:probable carboxylesterase 2 n=1 Tax=Impatiens glandulifera TaxID=253017 RepID=UPI001FB09B66|nr:probable carboxylesterase 2 [Impatiens glandulifera]
MATLKLNLALSCCLFFVFPLVILTISNLVSANPDKLFLFFFEAKSDGTVVRFFTPTLVPASLDAATNVQSTDVVLNPDTKVSGRLYRPMNAPSGTLHPLLIFFHGGGFSTGSAFSVDIHTYMNTLSSLGNLAILSVDYRLAPEHPVKDLYDDAYDGVLWVAKQAAGQGSSSEAWMKDVVNYDRIFVGGQSSGGNIAHNVGMRIQELKPAGVKLGGMIIIHSYFLTVDPLPSILKEPEDMRNNITELWSFVCPGTTGLDDPRVNPSLEPDLQIIKPAKVLICAAELDAMKDASKAYYDALKWSGVDTEFYLTQGKRHMFDNFDPKCPEAMALHSKIVSYMQ